LLNYLAKIKLNKRFVAAVNLVFSTPILLAKALFVKRTILLVTNKKITTINLNPFSQFAILTLFIWAIAIFVQSLSYSHVIDAKSQEISELRNVNGYFKQQFEDVNKKLAKVNEYLIFVTGGQKQNINSVPDDFEHPQNIKEQDLSKTDLHTLNEIKDANHLMINIKSRAEDRIKKIENVMETTGLGIKKFALNRQINKSKDLTASRDGQKIPEISLNEKGELTKAQGGPLVRKNGIVEDRNFQFASVINQSDFANQIDYLKALENLVQLMPLSKPLKNYYVSSSFGFRIDPITKTKSIHPGIDLAGASRANILSPSPGKVIFAGKKNGYGSAVIISHGYKITTLYGHLSTVKVRVGQSVGKGQIIAQQGSTGRSTGEHLHYEVRYKNIPLNPRKFLEAGDQLLNDENNSKYVSS
jgi:murein DD-endopeptidase MepM/ murein hydrolase activator NlpD